MFMVGFFDHKALFCKFKDLLKTIEQGNQTPFCTISGDFTWGKITIPLLHLCRNCLHILFASSLCVGSAACVLPVLGCVVSFQLQAAQDSEKDPLRPHHQCPACLGHPTPWCPHSPEGWLCVCICSMPVLGETWISPITPSFFQSAF